MTKQRNFSHLIEPVQGARTMQNLKTFTLRKPKGELETLTRLRTAESLSDGERIGVEILSDPPSIVCA